MLDRRRLTGLLDRDPGGGEATSVLTAEQHEYDDFDALQDDYHRRGWTDGLPGRAADSRAGRARSSPSPGSTRPRCSARSRRATRPSPPSWSRSTR